MSVSWLESFLSSWSIAFSRLSQIDQCWSQMTSRLHQNYWTRVPSMCNTCTINVRFVQGLCHRNHNAFVAPSCKQSKSVPFHVNRDSHTNKYLFDFGWHIFSEPIFVSLFWLCNKVQTYKFPSIFFSAISVKLTLAVNSGQ